jgi:hypothetical protein
MPFVFNTLWADDENTPILGPGQSRPKAGQQVKEFTLLVRRQGFSPMRWTTKAPSKKDAVMYATNRWPGSQAEILND